MILATGPCTKCMEKAQAKYIKCKADGGSDKACQKALAKAVAACLAGPCARRSIAPDGRRVELELIDGSLEELDVAAASDGVLNEWSHWRRLGYPVRAFVQDAAPRGRDCVKFTIGAPPGKIRLYNTCDRCQIAVINWYNEQIIERVRVEAHAFKEIKLHGSGIIEDDYDCPEVEEAPDDLLAAITEFVDALKAGHTPEAPTGAACFFTVGFESCSDGLTEDAARKLANKLGLGYRFYANRRCTDINCG